MYLKAWSGTDVGIMRDHNEDNHFISDELELCVVADGMGGHAAGEIASQIAVETIESVFRGHRKVGGSLGPAAGAGEAPAPRRTAVMEVSAFAGLGDGDGAEAALHTPAGVSHSARGDIEDTLVRAVRSASTAILEQVERNPEKAGMGTTVSLICHHNGEVYFAHVGDSRIYHVRPESVRQVSEDHSLVQEQIKAGILTEEEAKKSRFKNIITRSVGFDRNIEVDTGYVSVRPGDRFLLCSDGLSNLVSMEEIHEAVVKMAPEMAIKHCINLANARGGDDNITCVVAEIFAGERSAGAVKSPSVPTEDTIVIEDVGDEGEPTGGGEDGRGGEG